MRGRRALPPVLLGLLGLLMAACGPAPVPVVTWERVHDLVARFPEAEVSVAGVSGPSPYVLGQVALADTEFDDRDGLAYLRAPPGTVITYRDLGTRGAATLSFGCGVGWRHPAPEPGAVRFRVEARGDGDADFTTLLDRTCDPAELPEDGIVWFELGLPEARPAPEAWTLRFSTMATPSKPPGPVAWPAWFSPVLRSEGRPVGLDALPVRPVRVAADLLSLLDDAERIEPAGGGEPVSVALDVGQSGGGRGGRRLALAAPPPFRVRWHLTVPDEATLDFATGLAAADGWQQPGDGMLFAVEIDGDRVWSRVQDPHHVLEDRDWASATLDLTPWAGREVRLDLVTEPRGDALHDAGGWARPRVLQRTAVPRRARGEGPNVFVILVDTLRADRLGCYGAEDMETPRMDALAAAGRMVRGGRSVSSWTLPATATLLTGLEPYRHGVGWSLSHDLADDVVTLAEIFQQRGYTTAAFSANPLISRANNLHQGFETFVSTPEARARALNERVSLWLEDRRDLALFAYIHYYDPHSPYRPPAGWSRDPPDAPADPALVAQLRRLARRRGREARIDDLQRWLRENRIAYDDEVRAFDAALGEMLDDLEARGLLDDAVVVFTSDHGEEFLEHGMQSHGHQLYEESLRVPLIVTGFGRSALEPSVVDAPADVADVLPTLCDVLGVEVPGGGLPGRSLLAAPRPAPRFAQTGIGTDWETIGRTEKLSLLQHPWKLIWTPATGRTELYRLDRDPHERFDRSQGHPEERERLLAALEAWREAARAAEATRPEGVEEDTLHWMRELGYIDGPGDR